MYYSELLRGVLRIILNRILVCYETFYLIMNLHNSFIIVID